MRGASEVYVQMAQLAIGQTARVRVYAESSLRTARAAHDAKLEATALRLLGDDGRAVPAQDVRSAHDEPGRQDGDPASRIELARVHLATRRPAEALAVLEGIADDATLRQNPALEVSFLVMLGRAHGTGLRHRCANRSDLSRRAVFPTIKDFVPRTIVREFNGLSDVPFRFEWPKSPYVTTGIVEIDLLTHPRVMGRAVSIR